MSVCSFMNVCPCVYVFACMQNCLIVCMLVCVCMYVSFRSVGVRVSYMCLRACLTFLVPGCRRQVFNN